MIPRKIMFIGGTYYISLYKLDMIKLNAIKNDLVDIEDIVLLSSSQVRKHNQLKRNIKKNENRN